MNFNRVITRLIIAILLVGAAFMPPLRLQNAWVAPAYAEGDPMHTYVNAPDFKGAVGWLNTDKPISLKDLRGKVVLLDFWTFCCINCMHILPDLHKLEEKYKNDLVVIGIHSAKFENEKDTSNIREAIMRYNIQHPVANDAKFAIWNAYAVQAWPTLVLIAPDGKILGQVSGEGNFDTLDKAIANTIETYDKEGKLNHKPIQFALEKRKTHSLLSFPGKIYADPGAKLLYISDTGNNRVVVAGLDGHVKHIIGSGKQGVKDGSFTEASFNHPQGVALHGGYLFVCDTENHALRRIDFKQKKVETLAGDGHQARSGAAPDKAPAKQTQLNSPWDLTFVDDTMFIAMAGSHQLWRMDLADNTISVFAGTGNEGIKDGTRQTAWLAQPSGISNDGRNLYFADSEVSAVREVAADGKSDVRTIIGHGLFDFGDRDGGSGTALFQHPLGALFHDGVLYIADSYNHKIRIVNPSGRTATTFVGTGKPGSDDGTTPRFSEPGGLSAIGDTLYIADTNNHEIRTVNIKTKETHTLPIVSR